MIGLFFVYIYGQCDIRDGASWHGPVDFVGGTISYFDIPIYLSGSRTTVLVMDDDEFSASALAKQRAAQAETTRRAQEAALQEDPELRAIIMETKQVQKDTLVSTQNSVRTIKETIVVADKTGVTLKQQGEQLDRIDEKAQSADANATDSYQSARELHKYKGFIPISLKNVFTGAKKKDEDQKLAKASRKLDKQEQRIEEGDDVDKAKLVRTPAAAGTTTDYGGDETEKQINENLDEISAGLDHLQAQASGMNTELSRQNVAIKRVEATTEHTDYTLNSANRKIQEFM